MSNGDKGRRGRQGGIPPGITKRGEDFQKGMEPPYDADDIVSSYETGFMDAMKLVDYLLGNLKRQLEQNFFLRVPK